MKYTVLKPTEINVTHIRITLPVRYEEEDIPNDFPFRCSDVWQATVEIDTGKILDWPTDDRWKECEMHMKVCDGGIYKLLNNNMKQFTWVAEINQDYVPHGVVPGEYGDYVILKIKDGVITNWPRKPNLAAFFTLDA